MKIPFLLSLALCLSACSPTDSDANFQQTFICKSLIQGYLNAQQLKQYEFHKKVHENLKDVYIYKQAIVSNMVLGIPQTLSLKFECINLPNHIMELKLISPNMGETSVLHLRLMNKHLL